MISVYSVLYTLALFSELSGAVPASEAAEDGALERGGFFLGDDSMGEPGVISPGYRQRLALDADAREEDGGPKIIFVSVSVTLQLLFFGFGQNQETSSCQGRGHQLY